MRQAVVYVNGTKAALLVEEAKQAYVLTYDRNYEGQPISLTLPVRRDPYTFTSFPSFFEGLLPEGIMLENLLRTKKIDRHDFFSQLIVVGSDLVGGITLKELNE